MGLPRQEYWSGLPFPSPRNLPSIGIEPTFPELRMGGSVVEFSPVMREAQVYFLAHAATVTPFWASLVAQLVKNLPAVRETWVRSLGWEDPLEKGKATHSRILSWRIP